MDPLKDLAKWQAISNPWLASRKPEQLFSANFAESYERLHYDIWERIINLHGTIRTLEQLTEFPFNYLYGPNDMEFWRLVVRNFFDASIVQLHSLVSDSGSDSHTLQSFRDQIVKGPWLHNDGRDQLRETLRTRKWDDYLKSLVLRVRRIRHQRIAHRLIDKSTGERKEKLEGVTLKELRLLFDGTHSLFGALSFGSSYVTLAGDLAPSTVGGKPKRSCLEGVLDAILRDSDVVKQPELRAEWWSMDREHMDPAELQQLDILRRRVGLPEA